MKKNNFFILVAFSIMVIASLNNVSAFFPKSHIAFVIDGFQQVDSPITQMCRPYLNLVIDGNSGSDTGVIHYSDGEAIGSYIFTHTKGGYEKCLAEAGDNVQKKCICIGQATHIVQDPGGHLEGGIVEIGLKQFFGSNYFGHMTLERNFENKEIAYLTSIGDYAIVSGQLEYYDSMYLDSFFKMDSSGQLVPSEYMKLMSTVAGVDITGDAMAVRSGYQQSGFYNTVYKDKQSIVPFWAKGISLGVALLGLSMCLILIFLGKGKWKWLSLFFWALVFLFGLLLSSSVFLNLPPIWKLTTLVIEIPPMIKGWEVLAVSLLICIPIFLWGNKKYRWIFMGLFLALGIFGFFLFGSGGYLSVSDQSVISHYKATQEATNEFLRTGVLNVLDASGLSYTDQNGNYVVGALTNAEKGFKYIWYSIIPLIFFILFWMFWKAVRKK